MCRERKLPEMEIELNELQVEREGWKKKYDDLVESIGITFSKCTAHRYVFFVLATDHLNNRMIRIMSMKSTNVKLQVTHVALSSCRTLHIRRRKS
jgi:hypothetical protein